MSGHTIQDKTKTCHRACLFSSADLADTKKLNDSIEKISQPIDGKERPAGNSTYKKLAVQWLNEALCLVSSFVVADSLVLRNRQLLVAANRYRQV